MKLENVMTNITRKASIVKLKVVKHSPELLLIAGIAGGITSAVMACHATTKASAIIEETSKNLDAIHECSNNPAMAEKYTDEDRKKDLVITYVHAGVKFVKLYGPSVVIGGLSIAAILASNGILRKRNVALAAAFSSVSKSYDEYRNRIIERYGKEVDNDIRLGNHEEVVQETVTDDMGNEKQVTKAVKVYDHLLSPYAVCYDESNPNWERNANYNLMLLRSRLEWAQNKLNAEGYLFLNEVYDALGFPRTKEGQLVGWVSNGTVGDNFVDFGFGDGTDTRNLSEQAKKFVEGVEPSIWLDFNVQGNILDLIEDIR